MLWSLGFVIPGFLVTSALSGQGLSMASSAWSSYFNTCFKWAPMITWATDINTDLSCGRIMGPDVASSSSLSLDVTMAQGSSANLSDWQRSSSSVVLGLQYGPRWWSSYVAFNGNRSNGPQYRPWLWKAMQADMAPGLSSGLDVNIAQVSAQAIPLCMVLATV